MINNKQVNVWRGDDIPPTIYHVWIYDNRQMLLYNGTGWSVFIDDLATIAKINELTTRVTSVETAIGDLQNKTVNSKPIKNNPVLTGEDIASVSSGTFINGTDNISETLLQIDTLLTTQIIE